jgi:hypothetical protein
MKIIPFPGGSDVGPEENWAAELEAALIGTSDGPRADSWRELREDVRATAPPIAPEFERELGKRIAERRKRRGRLRRLGGRLGLLGAPRRPLAAALISGIGVLVAVSLIVSPWSGGGSQKGAREAFPTVGAAGPSSAASGKAAIQSALSPSAAATIPRVSVSPATAGRIQQRAASISLGVTPSEVQSTADRVSRLAASDGGFVQSSHVNVGQGTGEANLMLSLPSAKLSATLASLGQLAPVRAESQSLQDITDTYDATRRRLGDATAERQSLLRALAGATTAGQIDSLRERLSQSRNAIAQARSALQTVSQHASTAEVEVTVVGDGKAGSEALTLHRGIHDASRVLVVTLAVLLIAAAVLLPLALLIVALITAGRTWRRHQRERVLDTR